MPVNDEKSRREYKREWERKNRQGTRHKNWMGIFYEESAPDWRDEFSELMLPVVVSPVHDADTWTKSDEKKNPEHVAGVLKKPHRHWLAEYPNPVSYQEVCEDFAFLNSKNIKYAKSLPAMARYLVHRDNKDKAQYSPDGILEFGGANWLDWCSKCIDLHSSMKEMRVFIRENNFTEFVDFQDWCDEHNDEWSRLLDVSCAWAIGNYIDRQRNYGRQSIVPQDLENLRRLISPYDGIEIEEKDE